MSTYIAIGAKAIKVYLCQIGLLSKADIRSGHCFSDKVWRLLGDICNNY